MLIGILASPCRTRLQVVGSAWLDVSDAMSIVPPDRTVWTVSHCLMGKLCGPKVSSGSRGTDLLGGGLNWPSWDMLPWRRERRLCAVHKDSYLLNPRGRAYPLRSDFQYCNDAALAKSPSPDYQCQWKLICFYPNSAPDFSYANSRSEH